MKLGKPWKETAAARGVLVAWGISLIVAVLLMIVERDPLAPLVWIGACIVLPLLSNSKRTAIRAIALATMIAFGLFNLAAMAVIAVDGGWDARQVVAFALTATTSVAIILTLMVSWRNRAVDRPASATSVPMYAANNPEQSEPVEAAEAAPVVKPPKIFISYRRDDSQATTDRIFEHLASQFPRENLFRDIDSIPKGRDFRQWIDRSVAQCDVLLAIIGPQWLSIADDTGKPQLANPADFVRLELEAALRRDVPLIPVVIAKARMPKPDELPESLREFAYRNGTTVRHDPDFVSDMRRLIADLRAAATRTPGEAQEPT